MRVRFMPRAARGQAVHWSHGAPFHRAAGRGTNAGMDTATQFFTAPDGARLAFRDEGTGLPLLCLSGLTRTMDDFGYLRPHLPPCRLIRMDYRGRGASGFTGAPSYTVPQEGADALALLDHLGVERAAILGTSRGG